MQNERVSIIVPVFNMEKYLGRCLESVIAQSHKNLEIILVDDGSSDGSADICRRFAEKDGRITYFYQTNRGLGAARNMGIDMSGCRYIAFLDSDDCYGEHFVERVLGSMLDDRADIGLCDINYVDCVTGAVRPVRLRFKKSPVACSEDKSVVNKSRLFAWGKIFTRELIDRCDFRFPDITYEDSVIPILVANAKRVSYVSEPLMYYFRNRADSMSNDGGKADDILMGLQILHSRLIDLGLRQPYALEYKKIVLGQLRFACRRWGRSENGQVRASLSRLERYAAETFPELADVSRKTYYPHNSDTLRLALDNSLPRGEQLTCDIEAADCIVAFEDEIPDGYGHKRLIAVPKDGPGRRPGDDIVSVSFDLAELIMERL
ncbi:MAG: glycosyltransferase [Clostridiales Family XIII bacterium]|jgi:glycosyltransferase involved in cell wall biosynthesis|nr:glycosyltransferase [Clostridiales Family XIII bacterium]